MKSSDIVGLGMSVVFISLAIAETFHPYDRVMFFIGVLGAVLSFAAILHDIFFSKEIKHDEEWQDTLDNYRWIK